MKIIRETQVARAFLTRRLVEDTEVPSSVNQRIREIFGEALSPEKTVDRIIAAVRQQGDQALFDFSRRVDGVELAALEVTSEELEQACKTVSPDILSALNVAAERVRSFHRTQLDYSRKSFLSGALGQVVRPLEKVGIYVPGGTACYPSTVLMTAIPARVAGVPQIILTTPPRRDGSIPAPTLAAAAMAGVDRIFKVGGAQAIAALAYGTQSIPRVDKVCGPGNIFVTLAKKKVFGAVDIDGLQGPTETLILADETANPAFCAADLLAQSEHDPLASAILVTTSARLAERVNEEVKRQLSNLERASTAAQAIENNGAIIVVRDMEEAVELANLYAPEHLCLLVKDAAPYLDRIKHAGGIFVGESSPETLGDYVAGPSHVMPTGGTARFSSPLGVDDFLKTSSLVSLGKADLKTLGQAAANLARVEGLTAHALAVEKRLQEELS